MRVVFCSVETEILPFERHFLLMFTFCSLGLFISFKVLILLFYCFLSAKNYIISFFVFFFCDIERKEN